MFLLNRAAPLAVLLLVACGDSDDASARDPRATEQTEERAAGIETYGDPRARIAPEELETGRMDPSWQRVVQLDSVPNGDTTANPEGWDDISAESVNDGAMHLPLHGDVAGPSVLRAQILLDRALFSPGIIDGRWGKNTEKAIYWFQERESLPRTGRMDQRTFDRLIELAGEARRLAREHTLSDDDVSGPFVTIPEDIYDQAELDCMCYESLGEKLAERFHTSRDLLAQLNPEADLDALSAGDRIVVPAVRDEDARAEEDVARIVVSDGGFYVHALDSDGRILYHFPTTLGSEYSPSPSGDFRVTGISEDPTWHYQPDLLEGVPDDEEEALIPAGPNSPVGVVWMQLSKPHYGIHGTNEPQTIGYTTSNGCIRLTNWDAAFLSDRISDGTPVEFRDVNGERGDEPGQG